MKINWKLIKYSKKKFWYFMRAFAHPLSLTGMLVSMFLWTVTSKPEIILPSVLLAIFLFLPHVLNELIKCYDNYSNEVKKIGKMED